MKCLLVHHAASRNVPGNVFGQGFALGIGGPTQQSVVGGKGGRCGGRKGGRTGGSGGTGGVVRSQQTWAQFNGVVHVVVIGRPGTRLVPLC
jgi:hypothetical protein